MLIDGYNLYFLSYKQRNPSKSFWSSTWLYILAMD